MANKLDKWKLSAVKGIFEGKCRRKLFHVRAGKLLYVFLYCFSLVFCGFAVLVLYSPVFSQCLCCLNLYFTVLFLCFAVLVLYFPVLTCISCLSLVFCCLSAYTLFLFACDYF